MDFFMPSPTEVSMYRHFASSLTEVGIVGLLYMSIEAYVLVYDPNTGIL